MEILFLIIGTIWCLTAISAWADNKFDEIKTFFIYLSIGIAIAILPWVIGYYTFTVETKFHANVTEHDGTKYAVPVTYIQTVRTAPFWSCQDATKWEIVNDNKSN